MTQTRVLAQGTFDLLHPGHIYYLREAANIGDELHVIIGRHANEESAKQPLLPAEQRHDVVDSLGMVDETHIGNPTDIFVPLERIQPDIVAIGHDQPFDTDDLTEALREHGFNADVIRISEYRSDIERELVATSDIIDRILDERT